MKLSKYLIIAGVLLLTACQSEQTTEIPEESKVVSTETTAAETFIQEEAGNEESSAFINMEGGEPSLMKTESPHIRCHSKWMRHRR